METLTSIATSDDAPARRRGDRAHLSSRGDPRCALHDEFGSRTHYGRLAHRGRRAVFDLEPSALPPGVTLGRDGSSERRRIGLFNLARAADRYGQTDARVFDLVADEPDDVLPPPENPGCDCRATRTTRSDVPGAASWPRRVCAYDAQATSCERWVLACAFAFATSSAFAQAPAYQMESDTDTYAELQGGSVITFEGTLQPEDDGTASATLPVWFGYFGVDYTSLYISTNGFVSFDPIGDGVYDNDPFPTMGPPDNMLAVLWNDLVTDRATTHLVGTAPERAFVVQWETVEQFTISTPNGHPKFQVWLYEGPAGRFEFLYGAFAGYSPAGTSWDLSIGFENADATVGYGFPPCSATASCDGDFSRRSTARAIARFGCWSDLLARDRRAGVIYEEVPFNVASSLHEPTDPSFTRSTCSLRAMPRPTTRSTRPRRSRSIPGGTTATVPITLAGDAEALGPLRARRRSRERSRRTSRGQQRRVAAIAPRTAPRQPDFTSAIGLGSASASVGDRVAVESRWQTSAISGRDVGLFTCRRTKSSVSTIRVATAPHRLLQPRTLRAPFRRAPNTLGAGRH